MSVKDELLMRIAERREHTKHQSGWYAVKYDEYRQLLDLLEAVVKAFIPDNK